MNARGFLKLRIAGEAFGAELDVVREIISLGRLTAVPFTDPCVLGVINLRGNIVPVLDAALSLGRPETTNQPRRSILIVETQDQGESAEVGLAVDSVETVGDLTGEEVWDVPEFGVSIPKQFLLGIGRHGEDLLPLLDLRAILAPDRLARLVHS